MTAPGDVGSAYLPSLTDQSEFRFCNSFVDTRRYYSDRQLKRADAARNLLHTLAYPTVRDMKTVLKMNSIKNCPVTEQDVDLAVKIYGNDLASLKGKTTRRKPTPVVQDVVSIPPELVSIDTIFVNGMSFLTTISSHIRYRTAQWSPTGRWLPTLNNSKRYWLFTRGQASK
jgi:hypothetical protein